MGRYMVLYGMNQMNNKEFYFILNRIWESNDIIK